MSGNKSQEWRAVPNFPAYEVSEDGDIRRATLKGCYNRDGYRVYKLVAPDGRKLTAGAHRIVALAFLGDMPSHFHQVAHIDGDCTNNHYTNLRWATVKENVGEDRTKHGRAPVGARNGRSVLTENWVRQIKDAYDNGISQSDLARRWEVSTSCIHNIISGKTWRHV